MLICRLGKTNIELQISNNKFINLEKQRFNIKGFLGKEENILKSPVYKMFLINAD